MNVKEIMEKTNAEVEFNNFEYLKKNLLSEEEIHSRRKRLIKAKESLIREISELIKTADYGTISAYNELFAHMDRVLKMEASLYGSHTDSDGNGIYALEVF